MSKTGYIYTLTDPRTDEPRYVGATVNPTGRLRSHLRSPHNDDLEAWVDELDDEGLTPEMSVINVADVADLSEKEQLALDQLSERFDLLNEDERSGYPRHRTRSRGLADSSDSSSASSRRTNEDFDPSERQEAILDVLLAGRAAGEPWGYATVKRLSEETDTRKQYVTRALDGLLAAGWVTRPYHGLYRFAADPREGRDGSHAGTEGGE